MSETRWTLREMLIAFVWMSVGLALLRHVWLRSGTTSGPEISFFLLVHLCACAAFGAGVGTIFKRQRMGALVGLAVSPILPCVLIVIAALISQRR